MSGMTTGRTSRRITKRVVDAMGPGDLIWDTDVGGFGVRCQRAAKVYVLKTRVGGRQRWFSIGRHGSPWTPETARREALRLLGEIAAGRDPVDVRERNRTDFTMSQLSDLYLAEGCTTKKASTLAVDRGRIERHIKPLLGRRRVRSVARGDVEAFLRDVATGKTATDVRTGPRGRAIVKGGPGTASKAVKLLAVIFEFAIVRGLADANPARGVKKFPDHKNERYLSSDELRRLGQALTTAEADGESPIAIAAIRLLALTGCRKSEVLHLERGEIDFERRCLRLKDSKTGEKVIALGAPALELLASLPRLEGTPYVFPGESSGSHFVGLQKVWERVRRRAELNDVRLHDLRHSFASVGASGGASLPIIGALLGHRDQATTQRYAHLSNDPLQEAANQIASRIDAALNGTTKTAEVVGLKSA